jgi:hypothetical protein
MNFSFFLLIGLIAAGDDQTGLGTHEGMVPPIPAMIGLCPSAVSRSQGLTVFHSPDLPPM